MVFPENSNIRTQDLKPAFHDAGQFYIASEKTWLSKKNIFENGLPYILPKNRAIDIDNMEDWELAESIHEMHLRREK